MSKLRSAAVLAAALLAGCNTAPQTAESYMSVKETTPAAATRASRRR